MRPEKVLPILVVLSLVLCLALVQGCRKQRPGFETNVPPETFLSSVPLENSFVFYRVKLFWGGIDPDGQVVGYYYFMTDSKPTPGVNTWVWTTDTEAEFSLAANDSNTLGHRFYCKGLPRG
jgi:hypothetical protein